MNSQLITQSQNSLEAYARNLTGALQFASTLLGTQMVPTHFKRPQEVLAAILYGQELGFAPMQALQAIHVINGKPSLDTNAMKALIIQNGGRFETVKWTDTECTLRGVRGEWKEEFSYTMKDATQAQLNKKDNWLKMPKDMLYARVISRIARNMFGDVTKGFYTKEEMQDSASEEPKNVTPIKQTPPKLTTVQKQEIEDRKKTVETSTDGDSLEVLADGTVVNKGTGEVVEKGVVADIALAEAVDEIMGDSRVAVGTTGAYLEPDWSSYRWMYHLPYKKAGKDMAAVRAAVKDKGWQWRPSKDKMGNVNPGGTDCWYSNDDSKSLAEYRRDNPEYKLHAVLGDDDIPFG